MMPSRRSVIAAVVLSLSAGCVNGGGTTAVPSADPDLLRVDGRDPSGPVVLWHPGGPGIVEPSTFDDLIPSSLLDSSRVVYAVAEPWTAALDDWNDNRCHEVVREWMDEWLLGWGGGAAAEGDWDACALGQGHWAYGPQVYADTVAAFVSAGSIPREYEFVGASFGTVMAGALQDSAAPPQRTTLVSPLPRDETLEDLVRDRVERTGKAMEVEDPVARAWVLGARLVELLQTEEEDVDRDAVENDVMLGWQVSGVSEATLEAARATMQDGGGVPGMRRQGMAARFAIGAGEVDIAYVGYLDAMCATWPLTIEFAQPPEVLVGLHLPCSTAPDVSTPPAPELIDCVVVAEDDVVTGGYVPPNAEEVVRVDGGHSTFSTCSMP